MGVGGGGFKLTLILGHQLHFGSFASMLKIVFDQEI